jgi:hypothetical protein
MQEKIFTLFAPLLSQLPEVFGEEEITFDVHSLPIFEELSFDTDQIAFRNSWHDYNNDFRVQKFYMSANPRYYQILGLTIFCAILQNKTITINLTNPHSYLKKLVFSYEYDHGYNIGLVEKPLYFRHFANKIYGKNPYYGLEKSYFPGFFLTSEKDCYTEQDWAARDVLHLGQSSKAMAHFAELCLDFANPNNQQDELVFECEAGNCNVQPRSVELSMWLPGSLGWFYAADITV